MALGSNQPLKEMSTRNISWGGVKAAGAWGWQPYHLHVPIVLKYGSLNLLEPSGPVQACNGIALPFLDYVLTFPGKTSWPQSLGEEIAKLPHTIHQRVGCITAAEKLSDNKATEY